MNSRINIASGTVWEDIVGYSRAVKIGNLIEVTGTVAADASGNCIHINDAYEQTVFIIKKIENTLQQLGATLDNVIRTRMFVTDISRWNEYGEAHGLFFKNIKPCTTMVEIKQLIHPDFLIEIEATAIINEH